ncbi:plasminogen activator inhibitor 1 RNA-binding protein [Clonorchis sinensis]|uniref:Plasminogen activator inhibitor 1 RNA-binding protein n=1 Tax=Clonorchis sinensis TaxID=79923 RepID=H2KUC5_CLOSI|nr:plasminogen activator inhibitor 1 RNA-binding protein [Clonorchis sinensis]
MAGVDHAYQYSVEVKSRFSLFLDDPLSNEDPDLLQNRILNQRQERKKKEKPVTAVEEPKLADSFPENEVKPDDSGSKGTPKQNKTPQASALVTPSEPVSELPSKTPEEHVEPSAPRGRGAPRGFARGMRSRGLGPRGFTEGPPAGDFQAQSREMHFEPRGRGRGRGGFSRGRGSAFTDHREFDRSVGSDRVGPRAGYQKEVAHFADQPAEGDDSQQAPAPEGGDVERPEVEDSEKHELVNGEAEPVEEEPKTLTLEEYKALRSSTKPTIALASKGTRKANDGKDVFANMVPHRKINEVSDEEVEEVEKEPEVTCFFRYS